MFVIDTKFATGRMALVFSFVSTFPRQCQTNGFSRNLLFQAMIKKGIFPGIVVDIKDLRKQKVI